MYRSISIFSMFLTLLSVTPAMAASPTSHTSVARNILTQGHWGVRLESRFGSATSRFNSNGEKEDLAADYDGVELDADVFPILGFFGSSATLGTTHVDAEATAQLHKLTIGYGITENLTAGVVIPFGEMKTSISTAVSGGTMADNPFYDPSQPLSPTNLSHVPIGTFGTTQPTGIDGVQKILTSPEYGYEYKKLQSVTTRGIGDPLAGFYWRFHQGPKSSALLSSGIRFGLSDADDPDDLFDVPINNGNVDLESTLTYSRQITERWDWVGKVKYTVQFADHLKARAYAEGESIVPISRKEKLDRDLGDIFSPAIESGYRVGDFRAFLRMEFFRRGADSYSSPSGQDVSGLEANTKKEADFLWVGLTWNGVNAWKEKKLPWPVLCSLAHRSVYQGENITDTKYWYLTITSLF